MSTDHCHDDICITCSDTAVEVTIVEVHELAMATVDTGQGTEEVSIALVDAGAGDTILVHAGEAIAVVTRNETAAREE
ncbi:HypC/HybG/HupF family hydrogenase formation chaperone [Haloechinothrix halophila]|uniref:HypC/HybG/HupF family hydrogenase formation chaperone n=1 Tax=Haloechinothrix halophila TaxID=1069073 RepID=UPI0004122C30|nr:HypC/HybG/HupF family hydrogenase formation chaperone [Haloechinothrix halophila]